jgi:hypothetical protein
MESHSCSRLKLRKGLRRFSHDIENFTEEDVGRDRAWTMKNNLTELIEQMDLAGIHALAGL